MKSERVGYFHFGVVSGYRSLTYSKRAPVAREDGGEDSAWAQLESVLRILTPRYGVNGSS
jgi:hypothetical protein